MTDKEKAEYYDMWEDYFEPLARLRREIKKSIIAWDIKVIDETDDILDLVKNDVEVEEEVRNLLIKMIEDIQDE